MKTPDVIPFTPAEKRRVLRDAREDGRIPYDDLDRLLIDACMTQPRMTALLRSLKSVFIADARNPDDVLFGTLESSNAGSRSRDDYRLYADQVRTLRRLTRSEEHILARRLEFARERLREVVEGTELPEETRVRILDRGVNCDALRHELQDDTEDELSIAEIEAVIASLPCASQDPFVRSISADYERLRGHFVERNLYLVIGMSAAYRTYGLPVMDLIQEGNAALIRAVEKYDWRKNVRFQTYAAFWVRQAIERLITANRGIVRVPNYIQQKMRRFRREGKLPRNHKDMDVRDVSTLFDISAEGAARLMETDRNWYSLDVPVGEDNDSFASILEAEEGDDGMPVSELDALGNRLDEVMSKHLTEQEREIIRMRFGLRGSPRRTLDQIGAQMSVSRERIRQMQVKALGKLNTRGLL
jgi:RNA polymerase primary sigma factor